VTKETRVLGNKYPGQAFWPKQGEHARTKRRGRKAQMMVMMMMMKV
jgi:hypothetical protein